MRPKNPPQNSLIEALQNPGMYDHPVEKVEVVETHISWILLAGAYAYKIKKPVNLGFVDFSTLEKRHFYCQEELRLNRRLAPSLYLDLVKITGTWHQPVLNGTGPVIEYAVKMKQFDRNHELDKVLERGDLSVQLLDALAKELGEFHEKAGPAPEGSPYGTPERIAQPMRDNFIQIHPLVKDPEKLKQIDRVKGWTEASLNSSREKFLQRKKSGFIRECHGDLHLANMVLIDGRVVVFDCLEFNENLRFIDIMSDLAFLLMDLDDRGHPELAHRFLNHYLEAGGDYAGLDVLRIYKVYRAMVRAKVASIRLSQKGTGPEEQERLRQERQSYIELADRYTVPARLFLAITCGLSGSGKTFLTERIMEETGAVRIRTDIERKRMGGYSPLARTGGGLETGLYSPEMTQRIYQRLAELSGLILGAGYPVVVDGAFLKRNQREAFHEVARKAESPFVILEVLAPEADLRKRILQRSEGGRDASEADLEVLNWQIKTAEPFTPEEQSLALRVETGSSLDLKRTIEDLYRLTLH